MITSTKNCSVLVLCNDVNEPSRVSIVFASIKTVPNIDSLKEPVMKNNTRAIKPSAHPFKRNFAAMKSNEQKKALEIFSSLSPDRKEVQRCFNRRNKFLKVMTISIILQ